MARGKKLLAKKAHILQNLLPGIRREKRVLRGGGVSGVILNAGGFAACGVVYMTIE